MKCPRDLSRVGMKRNAGVQGTKSGGKCQLTIPPTPGHGVRGAGGVLPLRTRLLFPVGLLGPASISSHDRLE